MKSKNNGRVMRGISRKKIEKKLNLFEVHINSVKHKVLGQIMKSDRGLPGVSKTKALMKRKQTLLQEYNIRHKSNQFIDRRIGERTSNMTEDDRIMARFAAERMHIFNKKAMFNLSDTVILTHKGQRLSEIERFEDTRSDDEDDIDRRKTSGALQDEFVENAHFGGGMLTMSKHDRESLIDELIKESKKRKAERQRNKHETFEATEQLDEEWKTLGIIVTSNKDTGDFNNQKIQQQQSQSEEDVKDQYDIVVRQLKFEPYGQPTQRIKTEEEIAKLDREQLEELEKERLKQLRGIEINKYDSHKSADDIDDGFLNFYSFCPENGLSISDNEDESSGEYEERRCPSDEGTVTNSDFSEVNDVKEREIGDKEERSEEKTNNINICSKDPEAHKVDSENVESAEDDKTQLSSEETDDNSTGDDTSDEEYVMDDLTDLIPPLMDESETLIEPESTLSIKTTSINKKPKVPEMEVYSELDLPYILNIPENYESFKDLLANRSIAQQNIIFERLVKSNHPSLEVGNKKKMLTLAEYVVKHVSEGYITWKSLPVFVSQFNILKEFIKEECLIMIVESLSSKLEDLLRNTLPVKGVMFLTWYILVSLQPQGLDALVPLGKPVLSLVCSLVTRTNHVTIALLCCYLLLQDAKISSVLYPEAILFLNNCIRKTERGESSLFLRGRESSGPKDNKWNCEARDFRLHLDLEDSVEEHKVLYCSVLFLSGFVRVYMKYPQFKIMFREVTTSVRNIEIEKYTPKLVKEIKELQTLLRVVNSAQLTSLAKSAKKPKALRLYDPSFHSLTIRKSPQRGLPTEVQERQKLMHKYKHEMKGAMRELRRDRMFLTNVKLKEKALSDEQRIKKVKEIFSFAALQQGELRSLKRKK